MYICGMKEYILLRVSELDAIEAQALQKQQNNLDRPMSESSIEARAVLDVIKWVRERNVYTLPLPSDNMFIGER